MVSYRRSDSQAVAGRIVDRLISHFGSDAVFMDVDNIPFGIDFRDHIQTVLSRAAVLVAIVGSDWLGTEADKQRRIDDEDDPVRVELETALRQKLLVIPVLVNDAAMPKASVLPEGLRDFSFLNAAPVDVGRDFRPHVDRLIRSIESALAKGAPKAAAAGSTPAAAATSAQPSLPLVAFAAAMVLILAGGGIWWLSHSPVREIKAVSTRTVIAEAPPPPAAVAQSPNPTPPAAPGPSADDIRWDLLKDTTDVGLLMRFIEQYPGSPHRTEAEHRIASLAEQAPPAAVPPAPATAPAVPATPAVSSSPVDPIDASDWIRAQKADSYEAYRAYARRHPQGLHLAEAIQVAIAHALLAEPAIGRLPTGETVLVDDGVCDKDEIKAITGGDINKGISRTKKCLRRAQPF
jgi:hypothetical protein